MLFLLAALALPLARAGVARVPPSGWRSWNLFGPNVNQSLMTSIMDAVVSRSRLVDGVPTSLADLGYSDVGLDDNWQKCDSGVGGKGFHAPDGTPIVNEERFPDLGAMVAHAHALNLTAGWYGNNCICADQSANVSHFVGDVAAFRRYDFDSYKLDSCGAQKNIALYASLLANDGGRPVVIENCHNGCDEGLRMARARALTALPAHAHGMRARRAARSRPPRLRRPFYPEPSYKPDFPPWCPFSFYRTSVDAMVLYAAVFGVQLPHVRAFTAVNLSFPGCWAYADMLCVGALSRARSVSTAGVRRAVRGRCRARPHALPPATPLPPPRRRSEVGVSPGLHKNEVALTFSEARAHFGAWCIVSSPLVLGLDARDAAVMDAAWPIISNTEALAVNRAWAGSAGTRVAAADTNVSWPYCGAQYPTGCAVESWEVFAKPLAGGAAAVLFLNHDPSLARNLTLDLAAVPGLACGAGCAVRDVWRHAPRGAAAGSLSADVAAHDSEFFVLTPA